MKKVVSIEQTIVEKLKTLTPERQQQVLDFVELLQNKMPQQEFRHPDGTPRSAFEAAKDLAGCVDSGIGDLANNKKSMEA